MSIAKMNKRFDEVSKIENPETRSKQFGITVHAHFKGDLKAAYDEEPGYLGRKADELGIDLDTFRSAWARAIVS
jgi:hypothetical protein